MADVYKQIGLKVRRLRKRADMTQAQLAEAANITPDYLGRIERGRGAITLATLIQVARGLSVPLRHLIDIDDFATAPKDQVLKTIQTLLKKKNVEELRRVCAVLEAMEFQ